MDKENEQLEFDLGCKCTETTSYNDLCPTCLNECLEFMSSDTDFDDLEGYEHG